MKIISFDIEREYRGVMLKGICKVIAPTTYILTMKYPFEGLIKTEHFFADYGCLETDCVENIKGRAEWELGMLYEQHLDIRLQYDSYKKMYCEWIPLEQRLQRLRKQAMTCKQMTDMADQETVLLLDFYQEGLIMETAHLFEQLWRKYEMIPLSLSPSVLKTSIEIIENDFENP